ncbi:MAG: putative DNA binding domain-containing protein [Fibrobacteraceae bacterium]|nr:putative DNA binding domain-containing protein [Fibrobacteraceae bacterium]
MISKEEVLALLSSLESSRVERTISTTNTDKFGEAICAFCNDLPGTGKPGYLMIGANDKDGSFCGLKVTDTLIKNIAAIRTDGNIIPQPAMSVEKYSFLEGDVLVIEVQPSPFPPVRYKGRIWVRIGPRRGFANEAEERILIEKRIAQSSTFDALPCLHATLEDINLSIFKNFYLPTMFSEELLKEDTRTIEQQMQALGFYDCRHKCPTNAGLLIFGKTPIRFFRGNYIQYVRFQGEDRSGEIIKEVKFEGNLIEILRKMDDFIEYSFSSKRPVPVSALREEIVTNYPSSAIRELLMNAVMHRDYEANTPIHFYEYDKQIEIQNPGSLFGRARPENFPEVNDYRNPIIAEAMKTLGYVNRFSRGIIRVQKELKENGNGAPVFKLDLATAFEVRAKSNVDILKNKKVLAFLQNKPRYKKILSFCDKPRSRTEILKYLGLSVQTYNYSHYIKPLLEQNLLTVTLPEKKQHPNRNTFRRKTGK